MTATIVQQATGQADVTPVTITLPSPVTPGNLLIVVGSGRTGGLNLSPVIVSTITNRNFTSYGQVQAFLGRGYLDIAYRIATGDEQSLTWSTQHANIIMYELAGADDPTTFEVKSAHLHAASTTKALAAFSAPGDIQIAGFIWDEPTADETAGSGYTQDFQAYSLGHFEPASLYEHATSGATAQISGGTWAWAGMAIGVTPSFVAPPVAAFTYDPHGGIAPILVSFDGTGSTGDIDTYDWDFGDSGTSSDDTPLHLFTAAGAYTVSLTVTGPGGSDSVSHDVTVTAPDAGTADSLISFYDGYA